MKDKGVRAVLSNTPGSVRENGGFSNQKLLINLEIEKRRIMSISKIYDRSKRTQEKVGDFFKEKRGCDLFPEDIAQIMEAVQSLATDIRELRKIPKEESNGSPDVESFIEIIKMRISIIQLELKCHLKSILNCEPGRDRSQVVDENLDVLTAVDAITNLMTILNTEKTGQEHKTAL